MTRAALFALLLAGCGDSFEEPESVDLSKNPYDFSVPGTDDMKGHDLGIGDFAEPFDLTTLTDGDQTD